MSHGFMVFAVDTTKLRQVAGSHDDKLRRMIGGRFKHTLAQLDRLFAHQIADGGPNSYEALRQIVDGTIPSTIKNGAIHRYAFKLIVEHFGTPLDANAVCPWRGDLEDVDRALASRGVPFKLTSFYTTDLPIDLPYPDDFPVTGWLDEASVQKIHAAPLTPATLEPEFDSIVDSIREWFRAAASKRRGLVSYYH